MKKWRIDGKRPDPWFEDEHKRRLSEDPEYEWYYRNPWLTASNRMEGVIRFQIVGAALLFAAVWALFQWDHPVAAKGQEWVRSALGEELPLYAAYEWMEDRFGKVPTFVPAWDRPSEAEEVHANLGRIYIAPLSGNIVEPFGSIRSGAGVLMRASSGSSVSAMDTGLVLYAGETLETGQTVVIRHPDGVETVYGFLGAISVAKDQWVEAGDRIGRVKTAAEDQRNAGLLYFAVKKGNSFIDPTDVVSL